jgi:hypothetical protein
LTDGGKIILKSINLSDELNSFLKASGFTQIGWNGHETTAHRAQWQAAGALLKRKKQPAAAEAQANPWAQLSTGNVGTINEDELMKDST